MSYTATYVTDAETELQDLKNYVKELIKDQTLLLDSLKELTVAIAPISGASVNTSPLWRANKLLEKHGRYWK